MIRARRSPIDNPVGERPRQRVDEQCEEECGDEQEQRQDDVLLVVAPHQVEKALEGVGEPGEGGVRAAEDENKGAVRCSLPWQLSTDFLLFVYGLFYLLAIAVATKQQKCFLFYSLLWMEYVIDDECHGK